VVVEGQVAVAVGGLRVVAAEHALLQDDALGLQLNCLQEIAELELDARQLRDAGSNLFVHRPCDLQ